MDDQRCFFRPCSSQSRRLDDQRASFSNLPGLRLTQNNNKSVLGHLMTNDNKELDDQRCASPPATTKGPTVPDEDFFSLILHSQVKRTNEQSFFTKRSKQRH
ncbi:unnamed protein product [Nyctereutes procyonoides]|uniref:(raccoon dog) hypothetical protein n=1 Tax=Nyctereutes procyonoides TaxID=34880 RepID=A0A811YCP5_NYCPR|nr:unnamed protein product [Nyctereutes procyonoides]